MFSPYSSDGLAVAPGAGGVEPGMPGYEPGRFAITVWFFVCTSPDASR